MAKQQVELVFSFLYIASLMFLLVTCMVGNEPEPVDDITCEDALKALMPCKPYLDKSEPKPTGPCCLAVEKVKELANSTQVRRDLCQCFKKAAPGMGVDPQRAKALPESCHIRVPVPIDPQTDCSKVEFGRYYNLGA
ncbi:non-specific lipid-transfer protein AP10-like isoform X1 [Rhodamnia argentea]|uniref:Non-specific lipid-transfer protein AP10-like isoform X1 n=1 Tax=Rhodamnia argentea TaxID=178133 RepID=A0ABM3HXH2_9MYRT|nr:non-specific lipid-transfer protein AP10-like isoform X1 [Rhodamnia argentea]